jgi:hypothetical protein
VTPRRAIETNGFAGNCRSGRSRIRTWDLIAALPGGEMLEHAAYTAQLALHYVGATVLVVDPFDEDTDSYWREHWGFELSEQGVPHNRRLKRLWAVIPR